VILCRNLELALKKGAVIWYPMVEFESEDRLCVVLDVTNSLVKILWVTPRMKRGQTKWISLQLLKEWDARVVRGWYAVLVRALRWRRIRRGR
jgi:hypothetical protein